MRSKRRFFTNTRLELPIFTDRDLGKRFPEVLAKAGLTVERHHDLFPPDGSDEQWLEYCGQNGRIAISHDKRIRYRPNERAAVIRHRVPLLLVIGQAPHSGLAQNFVVTLPKISVFLSKHNPPYIAKIYRPSKSAIARNPNAQGTIELWYPS